MAPVILSVIGLFAIFAWIVALISAIRIVALAPKGSGLRTYGRLGWWQFTPIRAELGPAAEPHIIAYQRSFIAFFVCALGAIVVSSVLSGAA
ncbi:MAG TPA: hypothetical protein VG757_00920 [Devosia sp.]|nr:hypothetical protein [Devosia sp.]